MSTVTVSFAQLAQAALSMLDTATVHADDQSLALAATSKRFLRSIVDGSLIVSQPPAVVDSGGTARGSEGVVPAGGAIPPGALT